MMRDGGDLLLPIFYNVLQPGRSVSGKEQLELSHGFEQTREKRSRR